MGSLALASRFRADIASSLPPPTLPASRFSFTYSGPAAKVDRRPRRHERRLPRGMPPSKTAIAIVTFVCFTLWVSTLYFLLTYGSEPRIVNRSLDFIGPWVPAIGGVDLRKSLPKKVSDLRGGASSAAHYKPNLVKFPKVESPDVSDLSLSALSDRFAVSLESTDDFVEVLTLFALYRFEHQVPQGYR